VPYISGMKKYCFYFIHILICFIPIFVTAQAIDDNVSFRNIDSNKYFRINYENDFFTATDRDYTQGIYIEKVKPSFRNFPLSKLLLHPKNGNVKYGIALEDDGYTPNIIASAAIQNGDRPYAGVLFLKTFLTLTNAEKLERISVLLSTGIIGPAAQGEAMQKGIHHWIHYTQPLGWNNQIANDAVINYQVNYEKEIFSLRNYFSFASFNSARIGTLSDKTTTGFNLMIGDFYSPFKNNIHFPVKKFQWYAYAQPLVNLVGYDATLDGGVFNHSSPYIIPEEDINHFTIQYKAGLVLIFKRLYLEYYQTGISKEFTTSVYHKTGGLEVGFGF